MGFPALKVDKALRVTKNSGLQPAIDWLASHEDDNGEDEPSTTNTATSGHLNAAAAAAATGGETEGGEIKPEDITAQSLQCDDCGKLFRDSAAAEFHAVKTQHQNFSESTASIKPLTEEEKKIKLAELKERLAKKREDKRLLDEEENRNKEINRRRNAQDANAAREKLKEAEIRKQVEDRKREKEEDRIARQKIKDQIERDKQERAAKREAEKLAAQGIVKPSSPPTTSTTSSSSNLTASSAKNFTEARIQIRLQNGTALTSTFPATDALEKVYEFVNTEGGAAVVPGFKLSQTFPRKVFGDEDKKKSLKELGLAPSAALIVQL